MSYNPNYGSQPQYGSRTFRPYGHDGMGQQSGGYGGGGGGGGGSDNTLWMGNIDENMDEQFIEYAFKSFGTAVQNVKIIRNRDTGVPVGYGFITFDDGSTAQAALRELNGKVIPNTYEDKTFFLKQANRPQQQQGGGGGGGGRGGGQMSIHVGSLSPDIDDNILMSEFQSLYPSVISAKVIMSGGESKGFGFVAFDDENDFQAALANSNMMIGQTAISVSRARGQSGGGGGGGRNPRYQNQYGDNGDFKRKRTSDHVDQY